MRFAVPIILVALAFSVGCTPSDRPADPTTTTAAPRRPAATTTQATTTTAATTPANGQVITVTVAGGQVTPPPAPVDVKLGSPVVVEVTSDVADEVHVHGYDLSAEVRPGTPARIELVADRPGQFEVELESAHVLLLTLSVS